MASRIALWPGRDSIAFSLSALRSRTHARARSPCTSSSQSKVSVGSVVAVSAMVGAAKVIEVSNDASNNASNREAARRHSCSRCRVEVVTMAWISIACFGVTRWD